MRFIGALCILIFIAFPSEAAVTSLTLFLDGALCTQEIAVSRGVAEVSLPASMQAGSLRINPLDGSSLEFVEIVPLKLDQKHARETANLIKRRDALKDRLQTLEVKEEIFKAAAKSQSGKSPRKTKTNPDPMGVIRRGTEFAFNQLEDVYHARRIAESDLSSVEARLSALSREEKGSFVRIRLTGKRGRVAVSYIRSDLKWEPSYDFRLDKPGQAEVSMRAMLPKIEKGVSAKIAPVLLSEAADEPVLAIPPGKTPKIAGFTFPTTQEMIASVPASSLSFSFTNSYAKKLPAGEISCYWRGEYWGKSGFSGSLPGSVTKLTFGR